jgi:putative transposase
LTFYRLPLTHHKHLKSTNMLERVNRALAVETHENWIEAIRYLNMDDLREHKKEALRRLEAA